MNLTLRKDLEFIPEFNGNKELDDNEKIVVVLNNPSLQTKDRITARPEAKARADIKGNIEGMDIVYKDDDMPIFKAMVKKIKNLSYSTGSDQHVISTASDLLSAPADFAPLLDEIIKECKHVLQESEINEKN